MATNLSPDTLPLFQAAAARQALKAEAEVALEKARNDFVAADREKYEAHLEGGNHTRRIRADAAYIAAEIALAKAKKVRRQYN